MTEATTQSTTAAQSTDAALNAFCETLSEPQATAFRELWAAQCAENDQLREELSAKDERIDHLEEEVSSERDARTGLEDEFSNYQAMNEHDKGKLRRRITDLENRVEELEDQQQQAAAHPSSTGTPPMNDAETRTPLENVVSYPEDVAEQQLSVNQERARFIAKDVHDYAEKAPAGLVIDSTTIKKVLTASEGRTPHTQTVARVMTFLDEFGADDVELRKHRGNQIVVFDEDAATRYAAYHECGDGGNAHPPSPDVISG